jgi:uncharacterized cupin superfamily protein
MVAPRLPMIEGPVVTAIPLADRGPFGPPLGEPLDGPMPTAGLQLWTSGDGTIRTGLWECGPGRFRTTYDDEGEFIWLVAGTLICTEAGGPTTRLEVGDAMLFPPGWSGEWQIEGTLRKVLTGWTAGVGGAGRGAGPILATRTLRPAKAAALSLEENTPFPSERSPWPPQSHPLAQRQRRDRDRRLGGRCRPLPRRLWRLWRMRPHRQWRRAVHPRRRQPGLYAADGRLDDVPARLDRRVGDVLPLAQGLRYLGSMVAIGRPDRAEGNAAPVPDVDKERTSDPSARVPSRFVV